MFKERLKPTTKVETSLDLAPRILISETAITKMQVYVEECPDEIGWLGVAYRDEEENIISIKDVFLFDQEVHATTTEITPEGLTDFATEIVSKGDEGIELWNNMKVWGHSHVRMGITPSAQDNKQMETFKDSGFDWFIRIIANKQGELKVDLYDYKSSIVYLDLPWSEEMSQEEAQIMEQINNLYAVIDELSQNKYQGYEKEIKEEMKVKVRKKSYARPGTVTQIGKKKTNPNYGYGYQNGMYEQAYLDYTDDGVFAHYMDFEDEEEVERWFGASYLVYLANFRTIDQVETELYEGGYAQYIFTDRDLELIMSTALKLANQDI